MSFLTSFSCFVTHKRFNSFARYYLGTLLLSSGHVVYCINVWGGGQVTWTHHLAWFSLVPFLSFLTRFPLGPRKNVFYWKNNCASSVILGKIYVQKKLETHRHARLRDDICHLLKKKSNIILPLLCQVLHIFPNNSKYRFAHISWNAWWAPLSHITLEQTHTRFTAFAY